jgi:hypothetical protein
MASSSPVIRGFPEGAIVVFDEELRYLCAGGQGLAIVGLTPEMIEGRTIFHLMYLAYSKISIVAR